MPKRPEQGRPKEQQPLPYYLAASFRTREEAQEPYTRAQEIINTPAYDLELSAYRFERKPRDPKSPPIARPWYVVVIGDKPEEPLHQQLTDALRPGELSSLSLETVVTLDRRRTQETKKGTWVEGHYAAGKIMPEASIKFRRKPKGKGHRRRNR